MNARERVFADVMRESGIVLTHHPERFPLPALGTSYQPDFLGSDGIYYEVSGGYQAFSQGREKYEAWRRYYPMLTLRIVRPDGSPYPARAKRRRPGRFERR